MNKMVGLPRPRARASTAPGIRGVMQWKVTLQSETGVRMFHYVDFADAPKPDVLRRDLERIKQLRVVTMELVKHS